MLKMEVLKNLNKWGLIKLEKVLTFFLIKNQTQLIGYLQNYY